MREQALELVTDIEELEHRIAPSLFVITPGITIKSSLAVPDIGTVVDNGIVEVGLCPSTVGVWL